MPDTEQPPQKRPRRPRLPKHPDRLSALPLEILHLIASHLPLASLLSLTLLSRAFHRFAHSPDFELAWLRAVEDEGLPELEAHMTPREVAWLTGGRWCRTCGKSTGRTAKVDYFLRVRLCTKCWDEQIVYEGPDEPDPPFEEFFWGTKRYTPRSPFFLLPALESTSSFLSTLLAPQVAAFESAFAADPHSLVELDDYLVFSQLPAGIQEKLEERAEWARRVWRDGVRLGEWEKGRKEEERREKRRMREEKKREKERVEGDQAGESAAEAKPASVDGGDSMA
ncbi:hypothetical protein JCM8097_008359 [Rhodosporidiobolus ruineniae]